MAWWARTPPTTRRLARKRTVGLSAHVDAGLGIWSLEGRSQRNGLAGSGLTVGVRCLLARTQLAGSAPPAFDMDPLDAVCCGGIVRGWC
jgi:hypothetical protein